MVIAKRKKLVFIKNLIIKLTFVLERSRMRRRRRGVAIHHRTIRFYPAKLDYDE
ncbi:hypothetical protein HanXRQr2_Chr13g0568441 [Helianthus annuus]|uniref:Uncharacterized protein n=1 Tax=Helianthus annuus TaxID=4232 RepID=A0A9K3EG79_HELAN|nr:hypothetical protein HanXRQr2_Chr13g0568441 [Helianthus annuus]